MTLPIFLRVEAQSEFDEAFDWYEKQQSGLGLDFLACIGDVFEQISSMPEAFEIVFQDVRRAVVKRFPYLVLYKIESHQILVVAVFHSKRDPKIWQSRA